MIRLNNSLVISENDIVYKFSRSRGPGGQNVNKLNTRVTLLFKVGACRAFTNEQRKRLLTRLSSRISDGFLKVVSQRHRTQQANRRAALKRLAELLTAALKDKLVRKQTVVPRAAKQKRLQSKRRRGEIKQQRKPVSLQ